MLGVSTSGVHTPSSLVLAHCPLYNLHRVTKKCTKTSFCMKKFTLGFLVQIWWHRHHYTAIFCTHVVFDGSHERPKHALRLYQKYVTQKVSKCSVVSFFGNGHAHRCQPARPPVRAKSSLQLLTQLSNGRERQLLSLVGLA